MTFNTPPQKKKKKKKKKTLFLFGAIKMSFGQEFFIYFYLYFTCPNDNDKNLCSTLLYVIDGHLSVWMNQRFPVIPCRIPHNIHRVHDYNSSTLLMQQSRNPLFSESY